MFKSEYGTINRDIALKNIPGLRSSLGSFMYFPKDSDVSSDMQRHLKGLKELDLDIIEPLDTSVPLIFGTKPEYTDEDFARAVFNLKNNFSNERIQDALSLRDFVKSPVDAPRVYAAPLDTGSNIKKKGVQYENHQSKWKK